MCQGERKTAQNPAVKEGDYGQDEGPADSAVAQVVIGGFRSANTSHMFVVPTGGKGENADSKADACRKKINIKIYGTSWSIEFNSMPIQEN